MPECYTAAALDVWPGSFMSACSGTVLPLSFTEEIQTLEGVSVAENADAKELIKVNCTYRSESVLTEVKVYLQSEELSFLFHSLRKSKH